jgi:plasmid stabilization system protein ParE
VKQARFTALARAELLAEIAYYENRRAGLGARFRAEAEAASELAASSPKSGAPTAGVARRRLLSSFPFALVYTETDYGILVHAVAHNRRRPTYWIGRLRDEG